MTMSNEQKQARKLVGQKKQWLVSRGDEIGKLARGNSDWKNQIRALLEAARTEDEPLVVLNFLRYQAARNENWLEPQNVFEPLSGALEQCRADAAQEPGPAMALIRHLLAYTYRSYTFHSTEKKRQKAGRTS